MQWTEIISGFSCLRQAATLLTGPVMTAAPSLPKLVILDNLCLPAPDKKEYLYFSFAITGVNNLEEAYMRFTTT